MKNNASQRITSATLIADQLEDLLDEYEYCRLIKRSVASARRDRLLGRGCPYVKIGALVRYRPCDVLAYIEQNLRGVRPGTEAR